MLRRFVLGTCPWLVCLLVGNYAFGQIPFTSSLDGPQEPTASPGTGTATGTLSGGPGAFVFTYTGSFTGLLSPTNNAHIHEAPPGVPGPVVHPLDSFDLNVTAGLFSGEWRFDDPAPNNLTDARAATLIAGGMYFNIHTNQFPGGEIRGQILIVPEPSTLGLGAIAGIALLPRRRR